MERTNLKRTAEAHRDEFRRLCRAVPSTLVADRTAAPAPPTPAAPTAVAPTAAAPTPAAPTTPTAPAAPIAPTAADLEETERQLKAQAALQAKSLAKANELWLKAVGRWTFILLILGAAVTTGVIYAHRPLLYPHHPTLNPHDHRKASAYTWSIGVSIWLVLLLLLLGAVLLRRSGGLRRFFIGPDGRLSTSQTQAAVWTVAIAVVLLALLLAQPFGAASSMFAPTFKQLDLSYLLLLGFPYAALIAARGINGAKIDDATLQKVSASEAQLRDIFTGDDGRAALQDAQYLLFGLIALIYFVAQFATDYTVMPQLPDGLVELTGASALVYAGTKAALSNPPRISSVSRSLGSGPVRVGDSIDIRGVQFVPAGASDELQLANVRVRFGAREVAVLPELARGVYTNPAPNSVRVVVPEGTDAGAVSVCHHGRQCRVQRLPAGRHRGPARDHRHITHAGDPHRRRSPARHQRSVLRRQSGGQRLGVGPVRGRPHAGGFHHGHRSQRVGA